MSLIDIKVPNIGDFAEVGVIELLVNAGDTVAVDQSSSPWSRQGLHGNSFQPRRRREGNQGQGRRQGCRRLLVLSLEAAAGAAAPAQQQPLRLPQPLQHLWQPPWLPPCPVASNFAGTVDMDCDVVVLGGGPGGYSAAFRADLGLKVVLVERYATWAASA
jgi:dihydrolipoamide dehydrogenase